ncbi:MAG: FAD-dependent oxidoreductase [Candidatus Thorarchaeota archaeon]
MTPEHIRSLTLENRLVMLPMHLGLCSNGVVSSRVVDFYVHRARYRPGLIIVGGCYIEHVGMSLPSMIGISSDDYIDGLRKLVDAIHEHGVPVAAQLYHAGRYAHSLVIGERAVSASEVPCRLTNEIPRALTTEEVHAAARSFGLAARRAMTAGFDAVEILGSAGYLINQFLASVTNHRTDEYGGDLMARARFPLEVIQRVREMTSPEYPVIYRMSGEDFVEGGLTIEDNVRLAPLFEKQGVDAFNVTGGWHETRIPQTTMDVPRGHFAYLAERIAEVVNVPVIACNRINSPTLAEKILSRGKARLIGMGRAFLSDPAIPEKIRTGRRDEIRTCIGCNQGCLDRVFMMGAVTCAINPEAGFEGSRHIGDPLRGRIAVVGAGPAGMECARVLALRGAEVHLYDSHDRVGGLLRLAARIPGRGEFAAYTSFMQRELTRLGIMMHLGHTVARHELGDFDFVVCATGTIPTAPPVDGVESPTVFDACTVLENPPENVGRAIVLGDGSMACYAALFLSTIAECVHLLTERQHICEDIGRTTRWIVMKQIREHVKLHLGVRVSQVGKDFVILNEEGEVRLLSGDLLVVASTPEPRNRLAQSLSAAGIPCAPVGSAERPMDLLEAVHSAYQFANRLTLS